MRLFIFALLALTAFTPLNTYAQYGIGGPKTPALTTPVAPEAIPGIWRSDSGLNEAERLMLEKKYVESLTILDRIILRNMRNADAHVYAATAWMNLGATAKAKSAVTNALAIDKGHMGAYLVSGMIALHEKNRPQAEAYLSALRVVCHGETCPEFQTLQRTIRESKLN